MEKGKFLSAEIHDFTSEEAQQLLHNKFVVVIGDSNYRAIYKDLVYFLQKDETIPTAELREKHEPTFSNDCLVELNESSGNDYRLVRQYRTRHHLVRFYFITRAYSSYVDSIMNDFRAGLKADLVPDVVIVHSCLWDLNRYHDKFPTEPPVPKAIREYRQNTEKLFQALNEVLPSHTLIIWNTAMSITKDARGYIFEQPYKTSAEDMIEANFYSTDLAQAFLFDVLDLHYHFRFLQDLHAVDGTHWNFQAHRYLTKLLLTHMAEAWQVQLQKQRKLMGIPKFRKMSPWRKLEPASPQQIPTLWTNGSARDFYSRRPSHLRRNAHKKRLRARLGQCHQSPAQLGGPYEGLHREHNPWAFAALPDPRNSPTGLHLGPITSSECPQPIPGFYRRGPECGGYDMWPVGTTEQKHCPQPDLGCFSIPDSSDGHSRPTPLNIVEQQQGLQPPNYFQDDSWLMSLPKEGLWPSLYPRIDFPVHHDVRSGPWSTDGDEGDPGFPFHIEENHPNCFSGPVSFTHEEGWPPYSLPSRIPRGAWIGSRKMYLNRRRHANHRRRACAPYAASCKTSTDSY